tara:strand:- start:11242 stop:12051 length:810 start_codon:yes stop_codon:yes gene_type:complete
MIESYNDIKDKYLAVDFYLSKSCNKSCHYCTAWTLEMRNLNVDMDFLTHVLECFKNHKIKINLLGGEPGLIKNLEEVCDKIKEYENFKLSILSNSLIRKFYPWVLNDPHIYYIEHLVLDFYEYKIEKLGNYDFFGENDKNNYNLIIKTPNYFKYRGKYKLSKLDHKNTLLKAYNSRSPTYDVIEQAPEFDRKICAAFPKVPVIDFEIQKIRHCSKKVINGSRQFKINQKNIDKMMNFELFEFENYCKICTEVIDKRPKDQILKIVEVMK